MLLPMCRDATDSSRSGSCIRSRRMQRQQQPHPTKHWNRHGCLDGQLRLHWLQPHDTHHHRGIDSGLDQSGLNGPYHHLKLRPLELGQRSAQRNVQLPVHNSRHISVPLHASCGHDGHGHRAITHRARSPIARGHCSNRLRLAQLRQGATPYCSAVRAARKP